MAVRAEFQAARDLFNFNRYDPLADMYQAERRSSLLQAGTGMAMAAASTFFPPLALTTPAFMYGSAKAAQYFRPAAFALGAATGLLLGQVAHGPATPAVEIEPAFRNTAPPAPPQDSGNNPPPRWEATGNGTLVLLKPATKTLG